jgi:EpsI family protein
MTSRRSFVLGAACLFGAGSAYALKPKRKLSLLSAGKKLSDIVPASFGGWTSHEVSDLVAPETPDSLAARLYGETVGRIYQQDTTGAQIMMLMAHGEVESNELQLHRPEVCYPAFGFTLSQSQPLQILVGGSVSLPGRMLVAHSSERQETIVYWTRLGEFFPSNVTEQRLERIETEMQGYVADGLLARFSVTGDDSAASLDVMAKFIPKLVANVATVQRAAIIGSLRASQLAKIP